MQRRLLALSVGAIMCSVGRCWLFPLDAVVDIVAPPFCRAVSPPGSPLGDPVEHWRVTALEVGGVDIVVDTVAPLC